MRASDRAIGPLSLLDRVFIIAFMTLLSGATIPFAVDLILSPQIPKWPFYLALYAVGMLLAVLRGPWTLRGLSANHLIIWLGLFALFSTAWSVLPGETLAASMTLMGPMLFAIVLASAVRADEALRLLAVSSLLIALTNWLTILAIPSIGIDPSGPWAGTPRGLHTQKNALGATAAIAMTILAAYAQSDRQGRRSWVAMAFVLHLALVVVSRSTTSLILALVGVGLLFAPRRLLRLTALLLPSTLAVMASLIILAPDLTNLALAELAPLVGKDATMSNRLPIWQVLAPYVEQRFWTGYGFGVFWNDAVSPALIFERRLGFNPGSAHNGLLEVWLALGAVGVALSCVGLVQYFLRSAQALRSPSLIPIARLAMAVGVLQVAHNVTESAFLSRNEAEWLVFVWLWALLGVKLRSTPFRA